MGGRTGRKDWAEGLGRRTRQKDQTYRAAKLNWGCPPQPPQWATLCMALHTCTHLCYPNFCMCGGRYGFPWWINPSVWHHYGFSIGEIQTGATNMDFSNGEIRIRVTAWISPMVKSKLVPKIQISPSEKSIYACIYAHIWVIQICACVQADMDFSNGEIQVFDTSLDFSTGEIQTGARKLDLCNGEIHICMHICTYLGYPNMCIFAYIDRFLRWRNP